MARLLTATVGLRSWRLCAEWLAQAVSVSMPADRLYLAEGMPVLIVWGARDPIIPVEHGRCAHEAMPGSRLEIFEGAGHLPQIEAPARFVAALERFMSETEPSRLIPSYGGVESAPRATKGELDRCRAPPAPGGPSTTRRRDQDLRFDLPDSQSESVPTRPVWATIQAGGCRGCRRRRCHRCRCIAWAPAAPRPILRFVLLGAYAGGSLPLAEGEAVGRLGYASLVQRPL